MTDPVPHNPFRFCPHCGRPGISFRHDKAFVCRACGFVYFQNTATGVAVLLRRKEEILFVERARDPGRGLLDLPGGFVDAGETAEQALRREVHEELGMELPAVRYLGSFANIYPYKGVTYHTCDLVFVGEMARTPVTFNRDEIAAVQLLAPSAVARERIAFASIHAVLGAWLSGELADGEAGSGTHGKGEP